MFRLYIFIILTSLFYIVNSYRLLVISPVAAKSYSIIGQSVVTHLLKAGHEVTYLTGVRIEEQMEHLKQVVFKYDFNLLSDLTNISRWLEEDSRNLGRYLELSSKLGIDMLKSEAAQRLMMDRRSKYDAIIGHWAYNDLLAGISAIFQCPIIWLVSSEPHQMALSLLAEPSDAISNGNIFDEDYFPETFGAHILNIYCHIDQLRMVSNIRLSDTTLYRHLYNPAALKRGVILPPYQDLVSNASMVLFLTHPAVGLNLAVPPNAKYIGGIQVDLPVNPLPKELETIIGANKDGVIYFSMGANDNRKVFPKEIVAELVNLFGKLNQTVLWKYEDNMADLPPNVHVRNWFPQPQVLDHPNVRVFITHGGQNSVIEAIHYGIPIIGIPLLLDQFFNVRMATRKGFGVELQLGRNFSKELDVAIHELLNRESYTMKALEVSDIFHDRVVPPGVELVHWVEHVVRTRGADHLRSSALMVPWYQKAYLDLAAVFICIVIILYFISKLF